jgi:MFS family permease
MVNSIVGIYLEGKLGGRAIEYIGIGASIYFLAKGGFQIPIGLITDKIKKDKDDILFLLLGNILMGLPFFFYPTLQNPVVYFFLQFIFGLGSAMNLVNWRKLFAKNLDKGREGYNYAVYDSIMSIAGAVFSLITGYIASTNQVYFDLVIITIGALMLSSGIWVILIYFVSNRKA